MRNEAAARAAAPAPILVPAWQLTPLPKPTVIYAAAQTNGDISGY